MKRAERDVWILLIGVACVVAALAGIIYLLTGA